jgi:mannose-6-phosphate isomerase-like protein (cupin superfamily)
VRSLSGLNRSGCSRSDSKVNDLAVEPSWQRLDPYPAVPPATRYVLDVNAAEFGPDMRAEVARQVHTHPGPEIFYLLTGEQCLETPNGTTRARAGEGMVAPANTPMQLNIVGAEKRDAFFVVIHDFKTPRVTPSDWLSTGACDR